MTNETSKEQPEKTSEELKAQFEAWRDGQYIGSSETIKSVRAFYGW